MSFSRSISLRSNENPLHLLTEFYVLTTMYVSEVSGGGWQTFYKDINLKSKKWKDSFIVTPDISEAGSFSPCPWNNQVAVAITTRMMAAYWMCTTGWGSESRPISLCPVLLPAPLAAKLQRGPGRPFSCVPLFHLKKQPVRGKTAKPNSMHRVSSFSTKPHFILQCPDYDPALRTPSRAEARPPEELPPWTVRLKGPCGAGQPLPAGARGQPGSSAFSDKQADRGNVSYIPGIMVPETHWILRDDGAALSSCWLQFNISVGEQLGFRPLAEKARVQILAPPIIECYYSELVT